MMKRKGMGFYAAAVLFLSAASSAAWAQEPACLFQVSPAAINVYNDQVAELKVIASSPACSFSVKSASDWIAVSPESLQGSGVIHLAIAPNVRPRIGAIEISGQEIAVFQKGEKGFLVQGAAHRMGP